MIILNVGLSLSELSSVAIQNGSCCEKLVAEFGDSSVTQRKGERLPLEAATKQRVVKSVTDWGDSEFWSL